jgi:hypothetical protein
MNMKFASLALLAACGLAAAPAYSADNGFYLGAGVVKSEVTLSDDDEFFDSEEVLDDESFKVIAGFRPLDWLAFEANYIDLGKASEGDTDFDVNAIGAFVVGLYEIKLVDLFAKVGLVRWQANIGDSSFDEDDDDNTLAYGVGVGVHFGSIAVRAEYEQFEMEEVFGLEGLDFDSKLFSVSFTYTFL